MAERLEVMPVRGIGEITPGTDLAEVIVTAAPWLRDGDILVVTSKVVSKAEGRLVDVPADGPERDAAREALLAAETARPVARRGATRIVQTHHGFVLAGAGIDASNVESTRLVMLPKDPDASARGLRSALRDRFGLHVAVIVSDTMGRPWRNGLTDVALGAAGIEPMLDYRGQTDPYGNELNITQMAVVDELAGAAELVKGKADRVPVAVVRGYPYPPSDGSGALALVRAADADLFSLGTAEAHAAGLRDAAVLPDATRFGADTVDASAVTRALASVPPSPGVTLEPDGIDDDGLPPGTTHAVRCRVASDTHLVAAGVQIHRLRCALAAEGLTTAWLPADGPPLDGQLVGRLVIGPPCLRDHEVGVTEPRRS
jgi:coenzyme F420-0:L-glutamate ligase/coenzyme F420-1:gamma-L-glutamate ligase